MEGQRVGGVGGGGCGNGGEGENRGSGNHPPPRVPAHREVYPAALQRTSIQTTTDRRHHHNHHHQQHPHHQSHHPQHPQVVSSTSSTNPHHDSHQNERRLSKTSQHLSSSSHLSSQYDQKQLYASADPHHQTATYHQNHIQKSLSKGSMRVEEKLCNTKLEVTTCCCFSPRCHREHGSLFAALLGSISLTCLLAAIVTDTWIHTEDIITAPHPSFSRSNVEIGNSKKIEFTIGLWKVCRKLIQNEENMEVYLPASSVQKGKYLNLY